MTTTEHTETDDSTLLSNATGMLERYVTALDQYGALDDECLVKEGRQLLHILNQTGAMIVRRVHAHQRGELPRRKFGL